jgi:redox-sensitive bicupin YhaK (pirin superfamily)
VIERRLFHLLSGDRSDWLDAKHHFSPADASSGWGVCFWNDDEVAPNAGFPPHAHANMEIITYVRDGAVTHRDSLGNTGRIVAGDVQVMSAGTGIQHTEFNLEPQTTRLFQIWIRPKTGGGAPAWGTKPFPKQNRAGRLVTLASGFCHRRRGVADPRRSAPARRNIESRSKPHLRHGGRTVPLPRSVRRFGEGERCSSRRPRRHRHQRASSANDHGAAQQRSRAC